MLAAWHLNPFDMLHSLRTPFSDAKCVSEETFSFRVSYTFTIVPSFDHMGFASGNSVFISVFITKTCLFKYIQIY